MKLAASKFDVFMMQMIRRDLVHAGHTRAPRPPLLLGLLLFGALLGLANATQTHAPTSTCTSVNTNANAATHTSYYYTRTRSHPNHLRVSEELKNRYVEDEPIESRVNGTKYEYYKSTQSMGYDEFVFETIDKIFRHRLSPFYIHHYDRDEDKRRSSDPSRVSQEACARDLLYLAEKMPRGGQQQSQSQSQHADHFQDDERLTPELTAFFDSYARQEAGLLMGNTFWVGAYDQCVNRHIFEVMEPPETLSSDAAASTASPAAAGARRPKREQQQVISFRGQYCVSALRAPSWDRLIENKKRTARTYFKTERQRRDYAKLFRLQVGVCLPDSCDSTAFERHKDEIKLLTKSMLDARYADYELVDLYCLPDEASPLRRLSNSALGFLTFMALWLTAVLLATLADVLELFESDVEACGRARVSRIGQFVGWFSLRANYRKLMHVGASAPANAQHNQARAPSPSSSTQQQQQQRPTNPQEFQIDLKFLNAFKAVIMFWIINGHIMLLMIQTAKNILDSDALLNGLMHFLIGATFGVDLFFTMTGFLTAYLLFQSGHAYRMKPATWIYLSFHRYWRLAPMYLLTFWFSRSLMQSLGSGPLWDYGTSDITFRGLCNTESWWYPATLTSNLHGLFEECMITSWYISCDMQFWLVSPVFIYLLAKSPAQGWLVSTLTILASSKLRFDAILNDKSARYDELVQPRADIFMRVSHDLPALYTHPHYRISAYLVGLLAGHYVYMLKARKWHSILTFDLVAEQQESDACVGVNNVNISAQTKDNNDENKLCDKQKKTRVCREQSGNNCSERGAARANAAATSPLPRRPTKTKKNEVNNDDDDDDGGGGKQYDGNAADVNQGKDAKRITKGNGETKNISEMTTITRTMKTTKRMTRAQRGRRVRNALATLGLVLFLLMAFVSYLLAHYFPRRYLKYSKPLAGICYSVDHLVMSVGASLIIVTLCLGQWKGFVRFLSHPNWTRLSKINYALLLLQCEAIYYQIFRYDQVPMAGTKELTNILFNLLVTLYPIALLVTLVFEFPLANIEKLLLGSGGGGSTRNGAHASKTTDSGAGAGAGQRRERHRDAFASGEKKQQ